MSKAPKAEPSWMLFKIKSPISKFKEVFNKEVDQQWQLASAAFINLLVTSLNLGCLYYTQSSVVVRIEFEDNEHRRALWAGMMHFLAWVFICYMRRKYFAVPKLLGYLTFNIFVISYLYTQSYALCANTLGDPNSKMIYAAFAVSDAFFTYWYLILSDYIYPSGFLGFCAFPKFFFAVSFYFWFDDRALQITLFYFLSSALSYLQGVHAQELLLDCLDEEITEFGALDHYALLYLDIPYIVSKTIQGIKIAIMEAKDRLFTPKSAADKFVLVDENDQPVEQEKKGKKKTKNE